MATSTLTDADLHLRDAVMRQLEWDPEVDASGIGVAAKDGAVALTGVIDTYAGKLAAERATKRVRGVRGVANDIVVRLKVARTDADIALDVVRALELSGSVPGTVQAAVHHGHVTLTGAVGWLFQQRAAEQALRHVAGLHGISNYIEVARGAVTRDVQQRIKQALHHDADLDARHIEVTVAGDVATLRGEVSTWTQREIAEHAAANAPGIRSIDNQIRVVPLEPADELC